MRRILLLCLGWLLVALGLVGVIIPVLPTTPFLLLAAACFSSSSEKAYQFLLRSPHFGPFIQHYKMGCGVSTGRKVQAIVMLWVLLAIGAISMGKLWSYVAFAVIGAGVTCHLVMIKSAKRIPEESCVGTDAMPGDGQKEEAVK